jgi:DNA-binding transcriptional MerR regulator
MISTQSHPSTEFPYTTATLCDMFNIQDSTLKNLVQVLKLSPHIDATTQELRFHESDAERLKQAIGMHRQGKPLSEIVHLLGIHAPAQHTAPTSSASNELATASRPGQFTTPTESTGSQSPNSAENIASVVEAITHSKDFILNEMSRLLDDRLSGLDEVVVELIRTKSENDALRNKISSLNKELDAAKAEVNLFKPVQFGFYKKIKP